MPVWFGLLLPVFVFKYLHNKFRISGDINVDTVILLVEKYVYVQENNFLNCSLRIREEFFLSRVLQLVLPLATKNT
jgi:hypothetical protein